MYKLVDHGPEKVIGLPRQKFILGQRGLACDEL